MSIEVSSLNEEESDSLRAAFDCGPQSAGASAGSAKLSARCVPSLPVAAPRYPSLLSVQSSDGYAGVHALHTLYRYLRQTYSLESLLAALLPCLTYECTSHDKGLQSPRMTENPIGFPRSTSKRLAGFLRDPVISANFHSFNF